MAAPWLRVVKAQNRLLEAALSPPVLARFQALPRGAHGLNAIAAVQNQSMPPLVLLHGYGSGLGFFFRNLEHLPASGRSIVAVDWLGLGGSDRPNTGMPKKTIFACDGVKASERAVDFFVDSLKTFFDASPLLRNTPVVLMGHSLGGYLAARFALKHPEHVAKLILASPAGLPVVDDRPNRTSARSGFALGALIDGLWTANFTPQAVVRLAGDVRGRAWVHSIIQRRFGTDSEWASHHHEVAEYLFEISRAPPSGEYALNAILKPPVAAKGIVARVPLDGLFASHKHKLPPTLTLFGDHDWLASPSALKSAERVGQLALIPNAGHHLYLDNYRAFNKALLEFA